MLKRLTSARPWRSASRRWHCSAWRGSRLIAAGPTFVLAKSLLLAKSCHVLLCRHLLENAGVVGDGLGGHVPSDATKPRMTAKVAPMLDPEFLRASDVRHACQALVADDGEDAHAAGLDLSARFHWTAGDEVDVLPSSATAASPPPSKETLLNFAPIALPSS